MPKACLLPGNLAGGIDFLPPAPFLVEVESITTTILAQTAGAGVSLKRLVGVFCFIFVFNNPAPCFWLLNATANFVDS